MFSVELSTREWDGHVVVALDGELDLADAADVAAAPVTAAATEPEIIMDLAALEFTCSSGVAALVRGRAHARRTRRVVVPLRRPRRTHWPHIIVRSGTPSSGAEHGSQQQAGEAEASPLPHRRAAESMTVEDGPASQSAARTMTKSDPATVVSYPGRRDDR